MALKASLVGLVLAFSLPAEKTVLLVLHKGDSSLGFYTPEGKMETSVPVGKHPHEMILSPDGRLAYITDNGTMRIEQAGDGGNTVSVVDIVARKKVGQVSLGEFRRPHGIDLDRRTGRLIVTSELPDRVVWIDSSRRKVIKAFPTQGKTTHMVSYGPDGTWAFASNSGSATVSAVNLNSGEVITIPAGQRPEGSVLSKDGSELYVVNRDSSSVTIIDTGRRAAIGEFKTGPGPVRVAITPDGRYLVYACLEGKQVEIADLETRRVAGRVPLPAAVVSLTLSRDGRRAYASAEESDTVYVISVPDRKVLREFKTASGAAPDPVMEVTVP